MKARKKSITLATAVLVAYATCVAESIVPKPLFSDVVGVWSGFDLQRPQEFFRVEFETNGSGFVCINVLPSLNELYLIDGWSVTNYTIEVRLKNIPTPLDQKPIISKLDSTSGTGVFLEGELDLGYVKRRVRLYKEGVQQARSEGAKKYIQNWRKNKRL